MTLKLLVSQLVVLGLTCANALACDCVPPPTVQARLNEATVVFSGKVGEMVALPTSSVPNRVRFQVHRVYKGIAQTELVLLQGTSNCAYAFEQGESYLVFAYGAPSDLSANICSATQKLSEAGDEIKGLESMGKPNGYFLRDKMTGSLLLRANEFNMGEPITYAIKQIWHFDPQAAQWQLDRSLPPAAKRVVRSERQVYGAASDAVVAPVSDETGLFWIKWTENGTAFEAFAYSGMLCNDVDLRPPPAGYVAACVPYENRAEAVFVPDPRIHCVAEH